MFTKHEINIFAQSRGTPDNTVAGVRGLASVDISKVGVMCSDAVSRPCHQSP